MDYEKNLDYIRSKMPIAELYAALAEEAAELAHAALKYRRTITKDNPTPKAKEEALQSFLEELADMVICLNAINLPEEHLPKIQTIELQKIERWTQRLKEKENNSSKGEYKNEQQVF